MRGRKGKLGGLVLYDFKANKREDLSSKPKNMAYSLFTDEPIVQLSDQTLKSLIKWLLQHGLMIG